MKMVQGTMLGLVIAMGTLACSAQNAAIPFRQIERDAQLSAKMAVPASEEAISHSLEMPSGAASASGAVFVPPVFKALRTLTKGFFLINGLHLGMIVMDMAITQHCIAVHHCQEGNPLMPSSVAGQLGVGFALVSYGTFISFRMK